MRTDKDIKIIQKDGSNEKVLHPETNVSQIKDLLDGSGLIKSELLPSGGGSYTLPVATSTTLGGVMLATNESPVGSPQPVSNVADRFYRIQMTGSNQLLVNVPWVDVADDIYNKSETYSKAEVDALIVQELNNALGDIDSALDTLMGV